MKDINLSVKLQKAEIKWFVACFCAAFLMNIISIIVYKTSWSEVYTQILWILVIACAFYAISVAIRLLIFFIKKLF